MFWLTSLRKKYNEVWKLRPTLFELWIKVVCAAEASVSSAQFLLLEGICFAFHRTTAKLLSAINLQ